MSSHASSRTTSGTSRFQLWHTDSATLLEETDDLKEVVEAVQSFIDDGGLDILNVLALSEWDEDQNQATNSTGQQIRVVLDEHLAHV